jgi:hypothetical protein
VDLSLCKIREVLSFVETPILYIFIIGYMSKTEKQQPSSKIEHPCACMLTNAVDA